MQDLPPSGAVEDAVIGRAAALTPDEIEAVLSEFRTWLHNLPPDSAEPPPVANPVDLHTLVGQFTALRHEVNLQTRATRNQQEQTAESLRLLAETVEALECQADAARQSQQQSDDERLRPLLKGLVDLYDALAVAKRELERVREGVLPAGKLFSEPEKPFLEPPPEIQRPRWSFWDWLFKGTQAEAQWNEMVVVWRRIYAEQQEKKRAEQVMERVRGFVESVITGYTMSLQRLDRLLDQQGLEPMSCTGQPFDPDRMEVLDAVADSGRPSGEVVEEVRRGYLWRGRVFRFALVRVAKG